MSVSHYLISWIELNGGLLVILGVVYTASGLLDHWSDMLRLGLVLAASCIFIAVGSLIGALFAELAGFPIGAPTGAALNNAWELLLCAVPLGLYCLDAKRRTEKLLSFAQWGGSVFLALLFTVGEPHQAHYPVWVAALNGIAAGLSWWLLFFAFRRAPHLKKQQLYTTGVSLGIAGGFLLLIPPVLDLMSVKVR